MKCKIFEFLGLVDFLAPSFLFGIECLFDATTGDSGEFLCSFSAYPHDRRSYGGCDLLLISEELKSVSNPVPSGIEVVWACLNLDGSSFVAGAVHAFRGCGDDRLRRLQCLIAPIPDRSNPLAGELKLSRLCPKTGGVHQIPSISSMFRQQLTPLISKSALPPQHDGKASLICYSVIHLRLSEG